MAKLKDFINKLSKTKKTTYLIATLGLVLMLSIGIPTLGRFMNRNILVDNSVWDGSVANNYKSGTGTKSDPYIISNGAELAYFQSQLAITSYANTYFALSNDIILNKGIFYYEEVAGIQYIKDEVTYYLNYYSNDYFAAIDKTNLRSGSVNSFKSLADFKGDLAGNSYTIYGLYITDEEKDELALFTNLQGSVNDLYIQNAMIYGGSITGGFSSTATDASIKNVLFDGFVIGRDNNLTKEIKININNFDINLDNIEIVTPVSLTNNMPNFGTVISTSLTGNYLLTNATQNNTSIKINNTTINDGEFNVQLGDATLDNINVVTSTSSIESNPNLNFSNISYNIKYDYGVAGGIVAVANNTKIKNTINKAFVYGHSVSGGLVGVANSSLEITQSYNNNDIKSNSISGGLIGVIERSIDNINVTRSYNNGDIFAISVGGLVGSISDNVGLVSFNKVFNSSTTDYAIGIIDNTSVNVSDSYFVNGINAVNTGVINGEFSYATMEDLESKEFTINNLSFNEFISFEDLNLNEQNAWIYDNDSLPILFIDDVTNPIARIHASVYSWNNLSYELNPIPIYSNIIFSIEEANTLLPIKEKYYYISNSALTSEEVLQINAWETYTDVVQISNDGSYIIYAKIVDYNDNITYINTDILNLELVSSLIEIKYGQNTWSNLKYSLNSVYINKPINLNVEIDDEVIATSVKYYKTNELLDFDSLNAILEEEWTTYNNEIEIDEIGKYIIYVKVIDDEDKVTYINTDYIVYSGYTEDLIIGRTTGNYIDTNNITSKSLITLNFKYTNSSLNYISGYNHCLVSTILLPKGTKLTLIDNINNKIYEYQIEIDTDGYGYENSCDSSDSSCIKKATYPLSLFKEIGKGTDAKNYIENFYYDNGIVTENFTVVLDLINTNTLDNYTDVSLLMEVYDSNNKVIRPTLNSEIKKFNIYATKNEEPTKASLKLTTNYDDDNIIFNTDSVTDINLTTNINYQTINSKKIIDTNYEDQRVGLLIKLVDSEENIISREYLKNIIFKIGEESYYPDNNGLIRIDFDSALNNTTKKLTLITSENNNALDVGEYSLIITNYVSYDGKYEEELGLDEIIIPISVINESNIKYSFDIIVDDEIRIISKKLETATLSFNILQNGPLNNPNIRVSLYKKNELTAYNQEYGMVDLDLYTEEELNRYASNVYYVSTNPIKYTGRESSYNFFSIDLTTNTLENTGYKFVFSLYDGTTKIGTIDKYFIVK